MKHVYCSQCGTRLTILRKALPKFGRIINLVDPHVCLAEPIEYDLTPIDIPVFEVTVKEGEEIPHGLRLGPFRDDGYSNKSVQKLNKRQPPSIGTDDLKDRRKVEDVKSEVSSTAPRTLLDSIKVMHNTTPARDRGNEPEEE